MQIYLSSFTGWGDAIRTLFMSRGTWTPELDNEIRETVAKVIDRDGRFDPNSDSESCERFLKWTDSLFGFGRRHITMLRFLDFSFVVEGLHRGATDDWDAHAERYDNRIIRLSTRMNAMKNVDKTTMDLPVSDFYKGKILTLGQAAEKIGYEFPNTFEADGFTWVRSINGYVRSGFEDNYDVKRGLYPLGMSNLFIFKCNLCEYPHVRDLRMRKTPGHPQSGHAHPEIWDLVDMIDYELKKVHPAINSDFLDAIKQ